VKQPADNMTLSSEEGERLIASVHQSNLPAGVAERLEEIIRTCLWLVFALQESKITLKLSFRRACLTSLHGSVTSDLSFQRPTLDPL
jgi:hypothetical protein